MVCHCANTSQHQGEQFNGDYPSYQQQSMVDRPVAANKPMERIGPWVTGRVTWTPTAGIIGVRPVVDRYSITRYSIKDWEKKNQEVFNMTVSSGHLEKNVRSTVESIAAGADKHQSHNTTRLEERVKEVRDCQSELECLVKAFRQEIVFLTEIKIKLKYSLPALKMPESIAGECIDRRTTRLEQDLVNDDVEVELVKELALIKEIRDLYTKVIAEVEKQMQANRACKDQLEHTWSDKKETCELESINCCLRNNTPIITYHGGAARIPENQSSPESWTVFNATLITTAQAELEKSRRLRQMIEENVVEPSLRDLRNQADRVYSALIKRINESDHCRQMFERQLQEVLKQIADGESLYDQLIKLQRQLDLSTKVVQTRLENRLQRPRIENCRDPPQYGLLEEAKFINTSKSDLKNQIDAIDKTVSKLYETRSNLEFAILTKRKSLYVDQERCMAYREKYPDAVTLAGGN